MRRPIPGDTDELGRNIDADDLGTPPSGLDGKGSGAAAGVEEPHARHVVRELGEDLAAHGVAAGPYRGADPPKWSIRRHGGPGLQRSAIEVGFEPADPVAIGERAHQSYPSRSKISRSMSDLASSGSTPAQSIAARRRYSFCTASTSGEASISNSVAFFRRLRRMTS